MVSVEFSDGRAESYEGDAEQGKELADELRARFADWYYVISGADFASLRPEQGRLALVGLLKSVSVVTIRLPRCNDTANHGVAGVSER